MSMSIIMTTTKRSMTRTAPEAAMIITNITKGETDQAEPFPDFIKDMIQKGGLMASLKG